MKVQITPAEHKTEKRNKQHKNLLTQIYLNNYFIKLKIICISHYYVSKRNIVFSQECNNRSHLRSINRICVYNSLMRECNLNIPRFLFLGKNARPQCVDVNCAKPVSPCQKVLLKTLYFNSNHYLENYKYFSNIYKATHLI